jgi:hypothetical protein
LKTGTLVILMLLAASTTLAQAPGDSLAMSLQELEILQTPVRSFTNMETSWFNEHLGVSAARGKAWTLNPVEVSLEFIAAAGAPFESITCTKLPIESPKTATVTVIRGRYADDSLRATWHRIELKNVGISRWILTSAKRAYLCQRGPQTAYCAADLCP